jgi:hypothetical protein
VLFQLREIKTSQQTFDTLHSTVRVNPKNIVAIAHELAAHVLR